MKKIQYEIDPHNRLVIGGTGTKNDLPKFRQVIDGRFSLDKNNDLTYRVKAPLPENENIPHQIKLKGEWSLSEDHNLRLTLDGQGRQTFGDRITIEGEILDVDKNSLLFAVTTTTKDNTRTTYVLNLGGVWHADKNNRLSFHVRKESGKHDILTFNGVWEINKNHQIIYQYEKARLIRKKRQTHTLTFKGHWDIKDAVRVSYILSKDTESAFDLNVNAGTFRKDYIEYELGIGLARRAAPVKKAITLSGKWNLKKGAGLIFEIECGDKKIGRIVFGADAKLSDRDTVSFRLRSGADGKDIGAELELSRKILKGGGEAFFRALASKRELAIYAGAAWRW